MALSLDWEQADLQKNQEAAIIQVPLADQKDTYLLALDGQFTYKRVLKKPDGKQKINLFYSPEGILHFLAHENNGKLYFYALKKEAYNFYEHHINSKNKKYNSWEDFDFLDFDYIEDLQEWLTNLWVYSTTTEIDITTMLRCASSYIAAEYVAIHSYPLEFGESVQSYYSRVCQAHIYAWYNILLPSCSDPIYLSVFINAMDIFCTLALIPEPEPDKVPCPGDILPDMEIAPTVKGSIDGGRFGTDNRTDDYGRKKAHKGLDISAPVGTPFVAMHSGKVVFAGYNPVPSTAIPERTCWVDIKDGVCKKGFGNFVQVTSTVNGQSVAISYGHLSQIDVRVGQTIEQGSVIGLSGITGNASSEAKINPHVHIEVYDTKDGWKAIDPEPFLNTQFDANGNKKPGTGNCKRP